MSKEQTAVEYLFQLIDDFGIKKIDRKTILELEKKQSHRYAEFAIRCDRLDMKILNFDDFIKLK